MDHTEGSLMVWEFEESGTEVKAARIVISLVEGYLSLISIMLYWLVL